GLWTPVVAPRIVNGTLALGALPRTIDVGGDQAALPYELQISANLIGTGGLILANNNGTLLLDGNNAGLSGDVVRSNGNCAVASDPALGTGRVLINGGVLTPYGGKRPLANEFLFAGNGNVIGFLAGNNTAGVGAVGGGGNDLTFTGPVNVTAGTFLL